MLALTQKISFRPVFAPATCHTIPHRSQSFARQRLACKAAGDPIERAKEAEEKVEKQKAELIKQLENLKGVEAADDDTKQRAKQFVEELDSLQDELKEVVKKEETGGQKK